MNIDYIRRMPNSVLDAIKAGIWDYEPEKVDTEGFEPTSATAGSDEKIEVFRERLAQGLPLYHPEDNVPEDRGQKHDEEH